VHGESVVRIPKGVTRYALVGGSIFDAVAGEVLPNVAVLVEGNRIAAVCSPADLADDFYSVDITGCTIIPGLIDVHVHTEDWHAAFYLAHGVTTVRDVGCDVQFVLARRSRWNTSGARAPRLLCTGPLLDGPGNTWPAMTRVVHSPEEARAAVDSLVDKGVDQVKAYAFLDQPCFEAIVDQAHQRGRFVVAHLGQFVNARQAIQAGVDEIEHLSGMAEAMWWEEMQASDTWNWVRLWSAIDRDRMERLVALIVRSGTWMAITRTVWARLATIWDSRHLSHPQMGYAPERLRHFWATRFPKRVDQMDVPKNMPIPDRLERSQQLAGMSIFTTELIRHGARILIGTDVPFPFLMPGFSYHDELRELLTCGMSETTALQAATLWGAEALGMADQVGSIEPGKLADMVVVNGDPTDDIVAMEQIEAVIRGGHGHAPAALLEVGAQQTQKFDRRQTGKRFNAVY
jgi:imidazolonepropionase-like amidohydrolase